MSWVKQVVHELVNQYQTNDPYELAEIKKIQVIPWNLHHEIKGFYKYDKRNKYIFINSNLDEIFQRFVCSHEFGHSQLHPRINTPFLRSTTLFSVNRIEVEANCFAVNLLLHDNNFENCETKIDILRKYGIPLEMERYL